MTTVTLMCTGVQTQKTHHHYLPTAIAAIYPDDRRRVDAVRSKMGGDLLIFEPGNASYNHKAVA